MSDISPEESPHTTSLRYQMTLDYLVGVLLAYLYEQMRLGESGEDIDIVAVYGFFADALVRAGLTPDTISHVAFDDAYEWYDGRLRARKIEQHPLELLSGEELFRNVFLGQITSIVYLNMLEYTDSVPSHHDDSGDTTIGTYLVNRIYRLTPIDAIRIHVIRRMIGLPQLGERPTTKKHTTKKFPIELPPSIP